MNTIGYGQAGPSAAALSQMRQQLFTKLDANSDGGVDEAEFARGASSAPGTSGGSAPSESSLKAAFTAFDSDSDGKLTQDELSTGFQKLGNAVRATLIGQQEAGRGAGAPQRPSADELVAKLDTDQSGGVDEAEFIAGAPSGGRGPSESDLKEMFASFDADSDGSLSADELQAGFESHGPGGPHGGKGAGAPPPPPPQGQAATDDSEEEDNPFLSMLASSASGGSVNKTDLASLLTSFMKLQQSGSTQGMSATA